MNSFFTELYLWDLEELNCLKIYPIFNQEPPPPQKPGSLMSNYTVTSNIFCESVENNYITDTIFRQAESIPVSD